MRPSNSVEPYVPHVLVVGAGLVGLTLAQALEKEGISFSVFEREPNSVSRGLGWGITIHWGLPIFRTLMPSRVLDRVEKIGVNPAAERTGDKGKAAFYDLTTGIARFQTPAAERRRVKRDRLRQVLSEGLNIQWSKQLVAISQLENGRVAAEFADGTIAEGDLIVGCDGSRSVVRSILAGKNLQPTHKLPCRLLGATAVFDAETAQPMRDLDPYFLQGGDPTTDVFLYFSFLDTPSSNDQQDDDTYTCQIIVSWPFRPPELPEIPASATERVKLIKRLTKNWAEPFSSFIAALPNDNEPVPITLEDWSPVSETDAEKAWVNHAGNITLAGDAAHTMTMYRGEAFNHGLKDVESLLHHVKPILKDPNTQGDLTTAINSYEDEMCARGNIAVLASRQACLDAHEQSRVNENSPLVNRRVLK